ncbi:hypothetical protein NAT51_12005 [Flavobacterium amniphilum]|uniref:hypothetical protein n=1 Tax=Flavobacterium amniphilum TaxID=1834035 RepID=UPI002029D5CC|nr:hypothetical protein [Flavobacterium amniphilum]MCL9806251.1 hypothetical protein [Flavobacterium amniphilum]
MNNLSSTEKLNNLIAVLEVKQRMEYAELKDQFEVTIESMKPESIVSNVLSAFMSPSPSVKTGLAGTLLGLTTELISNKLINGKSNNLFKKLAGFGIQYIANKFSVKK